MKVCFEFRLEEDRTNAMSILPTPDVGSAAFSVKTLNHDRENSSGKNLSSFVNTARNNDIPRSSVGNCMVVPH